MDREERQKPSTVREVLRGTALFLENAGIDGAQMNAERLMEHVLGVSRTELFLRMDSSLGASRRKAFERLLRRRAHHEPLQYIIGETEFMSLPFRVNSHVLIPRPETEILVEQVILRMGKVEAPRLLDVGTGCGNIAVALAHFLTSAHVVGMDVSAEALALASENVRRNGVSDRVRFVRVDVNDKHWENVSEHFFDALVSNPPYVASGEWDTLPEEVREFEPRSALCDEGDGLGFFRAIGKQGKRRLREGGWIFFEVGDRQGEAVRSILESSGYQGVEISPDLNGIGRVVCGRWVDHTNR